MTPRDCRPPENTPDGTVCVVEADTNIKGMDGTVRVRLHWNRQRWETADGEHIPLNDDWRFHSIAEPPHGQ